MNMFNKISAAASIIAVASLMSCSDKGYWDEAPLEVGYSFQSSQYNETLSPGANEIVIPIDRTNNNGEETLAITFTPADGCPSDITVPSQVTFAAGSNTANIVINIANAMPPYTYAGTLGFSGEPSYAGISALKLNCPVNYTWSSIGTGKFLDAWVMGDVEEYSVEIMQAEGFNRWRVMQPYAAYYSSDAAKVDWEDWIASSGPSYIEFWEQADGSLMFNAYYSGLDYQAVSTQPINVYPYTALSSGVAGYDIWYAPGFAVLSPIYYIPGVGGFGQQAYALQIQLPE